MLRLREDRFDSAHISHCGKRESQQDSLIHDFPVGADAGILALADGMGGHNAGEIASRCVVTEAYSALKFGTERLHDSIDTAPDLFGKGLRSANRAIKAHTTAHPATRGMGSTLIALAIVENKLRWLSVGDSPLYLLRNQKLSQLNQNHSLAGQLDHLVRIGEMDAAMAADHPERHCLTSAVAGGKVAQTDCPADAVELKAGDIVLAASDGIQTLSHQQIERIISRNRKRAASVLVSRLVAAIGMEEDPHQDNIVISAIKVNHTRRLGKLAAIGPIPEFRTRRIEVPARRFHDMYNPAYLEPETSLIAAE